MIIMLRLSSLVRLCVCLFCMRVVDVLQLAVCVYCCLCAVLGATFMAEEVCRRVLSRRVQLNKRREVDLAESLFPILLLVIQYDGSINRLTKVVIYMFLMAAFLSMDVCDL